MTAAAKQPKKKPSKPKQNEKVDLVYFLGNGSVADNWEIKMSMRSFVSNFKDLGRIFLVGYRPWWIDPDAVSDGKTDLDRQVVHIPMPDPYKSCKDANLHHKMLRCATEDLLSEKFIRSSDDQLLLQEVDHTGFAPFVLENEEYVAAQILKYLDQKGKPNKWQIRLYRTHLRLKENGYSGHNYEGHIPYPIHKKFIKAILNFDLGHANGYTVNSLYFNAAYGPEATATHPRMNNQFIRCGVHSEDVPAREIRESFSKYRFCSFSDPGTRNPEFKKVVEETFPEPLPFEKASK